jgi:hypothetical protein
MDSAWLGRFEVAACSRTQPRRRASAVANACDSLRGLVCNRGSIGKCTLAYARVGEECGEPNGVPPRPACWQSHCGEENGSAPGTCVAYAQRGEACDDERKCVNLLLCVEGKCRTVQEARPLFDAGVPDAAAYEACMPR